MWGLLVDIIGRKWCFNITCLIASVFGLIFAAPSNFGGLCFICAMIGLGVGGNIPIDATITLEFLPTVRIGDRPIGIAKAEFADFFSNFRRTVDSSSALFRLSNLSVLSYRR
jgi:MFS family permease